MSEILTSIWSFLSQEKVLPAFIAAITTLVVMAATLFSKNYLETRILSSKLQTEHKFDQRKKIKEVLSMYKVQLLTVCEEANHRLWNFSINHEKNWMIVNGDFKVEHYYFHSTVYRILAVFAWIKKINDNMVYLDTTIASREDLDFIKFLKIFPSVFCNLTFLVGDNADGENATDHFFKTRFDALSNYILKEGNVCSYDDFIENLTNNTKQIDDLLSFIDGINPNEDRCRWDRLHLFHVTLLIFLNCYGYDFQHTSEEKIKKVLTKPKGSSFLSNYFLLIAEYRLGNNIQVKTFEKISKSL